MHRFTYSLLLVLGGSAVSGSVFAQNGRYGDPVDEPYDESEEGPYDDTDAPYDDYDIEPYDDSYDQPPGEEFGSVDTFYDTLSPYGRWIASPDYGLIWVPSRSVVGPGFVPYANGGTWQYTDVGWMFVSNWNWGWAPFHYGRWYLDPRWGWVWVPGSVWAPAWVDWRFGGGMIGWAPLPPRHHRTVWVFARARDMHRPQIHRYVVRSSPRFYRETVPVRHRVQSGRAYWYSGPRRDEVERVTRVPLRPIRMRPPRAGVVARVRVQGGQVREERVAPPRNRVITKSRRELPASRRQRPPERQGRPDTRGPEHGRDTREPERGRPDTREPQGRGRPDTREPQGRGRPDTREPPGHGPRTEPQRPEAQQPAERQRPDRQQPSERPNSEERQRPDRQQPSERPNSEERQRPDRQQPSERPNSEERQRPDRQQPDAREREAPKGDQRGAPSEERRDRDRGQGAKPPDKSDGPSGRGDRHKDKH